MLDKLRGRGKEEIAFRARQELFNLAYFLWAPSPGPAPAPSDPLPVLPVAKDVAKRLKGTPYAAEVERLAREIVAHRFPLLGFEVSTGPEIDWRRDYPNAISSPLAYWRRVPYLDRNAVGDHKNVWELNRHQHLVLLAQAFLLTGDRSFLDELFQQLEIWLEANPFQRGINWTSALEVAFRALSWIWIWHMVAEEMPPVLRKRFWTALYRHGLYLERNLSVYFSPNTHLLGEAVALHALGVLFPSLRKVSERWRGLGAATMRAQLDAQVRADGSHFEQSTYYHIYTLDMVLFHALLLPPDERSVYLPKLERMAEYADALLGVEASREIECFGDDDGGRFFHPFGERRQFGRATMAVASRMLGKWFHHAGSDWHEIGSWWCGDAAPPLTQPRSGAEAQQTVRIFRDTGMAVFARGDTHICCKFGTPGRGPAGHSHADVLSLTVRHRGERLLVDPGTFTYIGDEHWREWFRSTAAHNTVTVDGRNQATPVSAFRWANRPESGLDSHNHREIAVWCRYDGITHRRRVVWNLDAGLLVVEDRIEGEDRDEHVVEQLWHPGVPLLMLSPACFQLGQTAKLWANPDTQREFGEGWLSPSFGVKEPASVLRVRRTGTLPIRLVAVLDLDGRYEEWHPEWVTGEQLSIDSLLTPPAGS